MWIVGMRRMLAAAQGAFDPPDRAVPRASSARVWRVRGANGRQGSRTEGTSPACG
jgi:hypothetical protein